MQTPFDSSGSASYREEYDFYRSSTCYQQFVEERNKILCHKWIESEKAGQDIGFGKAKLDWIINHRSEWKKAR